MKGFLFGERRHAMFENDRIMHEGQLCLLDHLLRMQKKKSRSLERQLEPSYGNNEKDY